MCLRLLFLIVSRTLAALPLARRDETSKSVEILLLRHQLTVAQRQLGQSRSTMSWADRALIALLLGLIPKVRHPRLKLLVTPGTILRWRHDILRRRWAAKSLPKGRPPTRGNIKALVLRMAKDNEHWGYRRIAGELAGLGIKVAPSTVWTILKKAGIDPAPRRNSPTWAQFLRSQAKALLATDFFTVELLDGTTTYILTMMEHATRRIRILGATAHPTAPWTVQTARNALMDLEEHASRFKYLIRDHGPQFTTAFDAVFKAADIDIVTTAVRTPVMNASRNAGTGRYAPNSWTAHSSGTWRIYGPSWPSTRGSTTSIALTEPSTRPRHYDHFPTTSSTSTNFASPGAAVSEAFSTNTA